jgi:hypothetical protein
MPAELPAAILKGPWAPAITEAHEGEQVPELQRLGRFEQGKPSIDRGVGFITGEVSIRQSCDRRPGVDLVVNATQGCRQVTRGEDAVQKYYDGKSRAGHVTPA